MNRCLLLSVTILALSAPGLARAKFSKEFTYTYRQVWSAAIRLIRAEKSYKVKDKDRENGFILFVFPGQGSVKECAASLQIFSIVESGRRIRIRAQLDIAHQPTYIELHLLEQLERKLRDDFGPPPPARRKERPAPPPGDKPSRGEKNPSADKKSA